MRIRRATYVLLLALMVFVHCSQADDAVDVEQQRITVSILTEPPNLNSALATDQVSSFVLAHVMEGLLQYDPRGALAAGVAERWALRADGATFWLRRNAMWSDGRPVTAHDFVFAWRTVVAPATASQYAPSLFPIANAERINRGELPAEQLGVRAVDAYTLEVTFARPCPYFLGLTASHTFYPLREDFYRQRGERYAADAGDLLYNGAFTMTRWTHGAHLTLEKNPAYWNRDKIHLRSIDMPYFTSDTGALFNLYKNGSIAMADLEPDTLSESIERGYPVKPFSAGYMVFWEFNMRPGRITANRSFRYALQALFDPELLVNKIVRLPGTRTANSIFPRAFRIDGEPFIDRWPVPPPQRDLALARRWLEQARRELHLVNFPPLILLTSDREYSRREAEYFQQLLSAGLGLEVRIDRQIFKQTIEKMTKGEFDIVLAAWGPDYDDPMTFGDLMASWNENNRGRYSSEAYDAFVAQAQQETDTQKRAELFDRMQRQLMADVPLLISYEKALPYVLHPQLEGVRRSPFGGDPDFRYARVVKKP